MGTGILNLTYKVGKIEEKVGTSTKQFGALARDFKEHIKHK